MVDNCVMVMGIGWKKMRKDTGSDLVSEELADVEQSSKSADESNAGPSSIFPPSKQPVLLHDSLRRW